MDKAKANRMMSRALRRLKKEFPDLEVRYAGRGRFTNTTLTLKVELAEKDGSGQAMTQIVKDYNLFRSFNGLPEIGTVFTSPMGGEYRICGYNRRAKKMPVLAERVDDGRKFKFPVYAVKNALATKGK